MEIKLIVFVESFHLTTVSSIKLTCGTLKGEGFIGKSVVGFSIYLLKN